MPDDYHHNDRKTIRLREYDYSQPGEYFITICTYGKQNIFGTVNEDSVLLSPIGRIVKRCWEDIPKHFKNVELDEFIIMPNHFHGIIILHEHVGTRHAVSLREQFGKPIKRSISTIVRSFKSAVTKNVNEMQLSYEVRLWQSRYYDRIIRNDKELDNVRDYIANNPINWQLDGENPAIKP